MWIIITVVTLYLVGLGWWLYVRFFKKGKQVVKLTGANQFVVEHNGHKVVIDYDHLKNKVLVEFSDEGMTFKVVDGLFHEPRIAEVTEEEIIMKAPEKARPADDDSTDEELDLHKMKQMGNVTKF